jgi:hypothetical protein
MRIWETIVLVAAAATAFKIPANLTNGLYQRSIDDNGNEVIEQLDEFSEYSDPLAPDLDPTTTSHLLRWAKRDYLEPWRIEKDITWKGVDPPFNDENRTWYPKGFSRWEVINARLWCSCGEQLNHTNILKATKLFEDILAWHRGGTYIRYEQPRFGIYGDVVAFTCNDSFMKHQYVLNKHSYRKILWLFRFHCGVDVPATYMRRGSLGESTGFKKYVPDTGICEHLRDAPLRRCGSAPVVAETLP